MTESATISGTNRGRGNGVKGSTSHQELDEVADDFEEDAVVFVEPDEDEIDDDEDFADAPVDFDESDDDDDEEDEDATTKRSRAKKTSDDDDDEDGDDDTEEDLEAILKARLGTQDDDEEEDDDDKEEENKPRVVASRPRQALVEDGPNFTVHPRQASEWVCAECFLIVNKAAAAATTCPHCGADAVNARR